MSDSRRTPSRAVLSGTLVAVLIGGFVLGVWFDRLWHKPAAEIKPDPRLVGKWIDDAERTPLEFKSDGTFEYIKVTHIRMSVEGKPDPTPQRKEERVSGQYRWVDGGTIELLEPDFGAWIAVRVMIDGDRLSLLRKDGSVSRYRRGG
jgi:hypothetical protein